MESVNPIVSVIIPAYNRERLISRALESVLAQTYTNLEIIVVDDASTDGTEEVIRSYRDDRIRYVRHERNRGGSAARNTGLRLATGDYVAFLDSDDEWLPEKIHRHVDVLRSHPDHAVTYSAVKVVYPDGSGCITYHDGPQGDVFERVMIGNCVGPTSSFVIRRECFRTVGGFDESLPSAQDYDMWIRLAKYYKFRRIDEPLVVYHWHGEQISTNVEAARLGRLAVLDKYREDLLRMHPRVVADKYFRLARFLIGSGYVSEGRRFLWQALSIYPFRPQYSLYLVVSLLGSRGYSRLRSFRKKGRARLAT